jgi:hypothetical protein
VPGWIRTAAHTPRPLFGQEPVVGTVNEMLVPLLLEVRLAYVLVPNFTVFPVAVKLVPVIVVCDPLAPEDGESEVIVGTLFLQWLFIDFSV